MLPYQQHTTGVKGEIIYNNMTCFNFQILHMTCTIEWDYFYMQCIMVDSPLTHVPPPYTQTHIGNSIWSVLAAKDSWAISCVIPIKPHFTEQVTNFDLENSTSWSRDYSRNKLSCTWKRALMNYYDIISSTYMKLIYLHLYSHLFPIPFISWSCDMLAWSHDM